MIRWMCLPLVLLNTSGLLIFIYGDPIIERKPLFLEVTAGETATLDCPSNDESHRFQFWQLKTNEILGPGNRIDRKKYKYEVLTGRLFIKGVSMKEHGLYTCVCKHLTNTTYNAGSVMLIVRNSENWEEMWENDYTVNLARVATVSIAVLVLLSIVLIIYNTMKRDQILQFRDFTDEPVLDEVTSRKGSYSFGRTGRNIEMKEGIDNLGLDMSRESTPPTFLYNSRHD